MNSDRTGLIHSTTAGELGSVDTRVTKSARVGMWGWGSREDIQQRDHGVIRTKLARSEVRDAQRKGSWLSLAGFWKLLWG